MMTEDFTKLPLGSLVSASRRIVRCPQCGRRGALQSRGAGLQYVHVEASSNQGGWFVEPTDHCELKPPDDDTRHRDRGDPEEFPVDPALKDPPFIPPGEDSGEWTRGRGADPNEVKKIERPKEP